MYGYVLRLQALDGYYTKFVDVFDTDRFTHILYVHHTGKQGDNPHYHFVIRTDYRTDALRKYLKGHFDLAKGNRHLSLKAWDGDVRACSYLYHEGTKVVSMKGFTDDELVLFKEKNDEVQKEIKRKSPIKIIADCVAHFKENKRLPSHSDIFMFIMNRLRVQGDFLPNKFQMDRWILRIQADLMDDGQFKSYMIELYENWYGNFAFKV